MLVQFVQFESSLTDAEMWKVAEDRAPDYRATPGLIQKYYVKLDRPNCWGGIMIWESPAALAAFRESDLARTVAQAYHTVAPPQINVFEMMFPLRPEAMAKTLEWTA